jgi:C1A family cysteine protease
MAIALPAAVDWRNNGGDWTTPVKDQQNCGSCVSFSTCATIESRIKLACQDAAMTPDLSEAHLFFCGCPNCCVPGWNFVPALEFARLTGVATDADFLYQPQNQPCPSGLQPYVKIKAYTELLATDTRKSVLAAKGPVVAGLAIYSDFYNYTGGVYRQTSNTLEGYHAVSCVGYDDGQQCWIVKNSWGPGFGEAGYFRIGYGECGIDTDFAFYDVEVDCPSPGPGPGPGPGPVPDECTELVQFLNQVLRALRQYPRLRRYLRYYVCGRGPLVPYNARWQRVADAVNRVLDACPQYRDRFCELVR